MKHTYTIVWSMRDSENELISYLGSSHDTEKEANDVAAKIAHELWDQYPSMSWMVLKHEFKWKTIDETNEEPF